jgi:integrase
MDVLKQHRVAQNEERLKLGSLWEDWGLLFCSERGTPMNRRELTRRSFKPLLKRACLPDIRFHDLRHTCATLLLSRGHHPKLVQELLGHASVAITLDRYSHVLPGMSDQTAAAMESALSKPRWCMNWCKEGRDRFSAFFFALRLSWKSSIFPDEQMGLTT